MPVCANISADVTFDCNNPPQVGADETLYLMNKSEISAWAEASGVLGALTMNATTYIYKIEGVNKSLNGLSEITRDGFSPGFLHSVTQVLPNNAQASKEQLENLAKGRVVAIIERNDQTFEVYGRNQGLYVTVANGDINNIDTDGGISFTLSTPDGEKEAKLPQQYLDVDYATTKAAIVALAAP